ncbi:MAG: hypothetical protein ACD_51C00186G0001 [uncultured bacterium]|nr:MAG: hypothetical protein ACD_51C00186G0001 [uncultured bacterium]
MTKKLSIPMLLKNHVLRRHATKQSLSLFFHVYFHHYVTYPTANFQKEMFGLLEDDSIKNLAIVAFRGSSKSTIVNMAYPIWAIMGKPQKKFILILGQTQNQARQHLRNLKTELESNELLRADLGPFEEDENEWNAYSLFIPKYNARIMAASSEQSVRGFRHGQYRPQIIICDDIEDLASVKTLESRNKSSQWLTSEVMPAGDKDTRTIIIGNLLHEDSLIMRIKKAMQDKELDGIFREYPLVNSDGICLWPGKYPNKEAIEQERRRIGNEPAWQREYMLQIVTDTDRVIHPEWISYYDETPKDRSGDFTGAYVGVDLAISQNDSADYTAMVSCYAFGSGKDFKIYILPNPVNARLTHLETLREAENLSDTICPDRKATLYIEEVGYQGATTEQLKRDGYPAESVPIHGQDKRARLTAVSHIIQDGTVLFPRRGAEKLIQQLTRFGMERHDDLADALSILLSKMVDIRGYNHNSRFRSGGRTIFGDIMHKQF